jgi:hypothetical protein
MPEVPQAQGLSAPACSTFLFPDDIPRALEWADGAENKHGQGSTCGRMANEIIALRRKNAFLRDEIAMLREALKKILSESYLGHHSSCLRCAEVNEIADHILSNASSDRIPGHKEDSQ